MPKSSLPRDDLRVSPYRGQFDRKVGSRKFQSQTITCESHVKSHAKSHVMSHVKSHVELCQSNRGVCNFRLSRHRSRRVPRETRAIRIQSWSRTSRLSRQVPVEAPSQTRPSRISPGSSPRPFLVLLARGDVGELGYSEYYEQSASRSDVVTDHSPLLVGAQ